MSSTTAFTGPAATRLGDGGHEELFLTRDLYAVFGSKGEVRSAISVLLKEIERR